ncbi:MAG: D-alanyl-D-alanine carboxypeptidase [Acetobacteraceae bacterium]|nr:D-alanyl-D-alanine carboxypeptidase [Acetobacteraceae bacterium]
MGSAKTSAGCAPGRGQSEDASRRAGRRLRAALGAAAAVAALAMCLGVGRGTGWGAAEIPPPTPAQAEASPPGPFRVEATAAYLLDATTGQELQAQDAGRPLDPASLVKMMTLRLVYRDLAQGRATLEDRVPVSVKAWRTGGSRMFIDPRQKVRLEDLILGVAVSSGNDACVALAEYLAGSEEAFVAEMNREAERLGLSGTRFCNSHGISEPGQQMTARDAAVLGARLVTDYPESLAALSAREFTYNGITQPNRNRLLFIDPTVDGIKTGHTEAAGYNLVATARRDSMRLVAVVMGAPSEAVREEAAARLLDYGFRNFTTQVLARPGEALGRVAVYKGRRNWVEVTPARLLAVTLPRGQEGAARWTLKLRGALVAPVAAGQEVGELLALVDQQVVARAPAAAASAVARGNWLKVAWDSIRLFFRGALGRGTLAASGGG